MHNFICYYYIIFGVLAHLLYIIFGVSYNQVKKHENKQITDQEEKENDRDNKIIFKHMGSL